MFDSNSYICMHTDETKRSHTYLFIRHLHTEQFLPNLTWRIFLLTFLDQYIIIFNLHSAIDFPRHLSLALSKMYK